mmetsp:Transcript_56347/g.100266  ORF Transcript_56347/g.100266 Transcript_56347/m.100266 type:complete len:218 (-) Transcript_56347:363-1016(-)
MLNAAVEQALGDVHGGLLVVAAVGGAAHYVGAIPVDDARAASRGVDVVAVDKFLVSVRPCDVAAVNGHDDTAHEADASLVLPDAAAWIGVLTHERPVRLDMHVCLRAPAAVWKDTARYPEPPRLARATATFQLQETFDGRIPWSPPRSSHRGWMTKSQHCARVAYPSCHFFLDSPGVLCSALPRHSRVRKCHLSNHAVWPASALSLPTTRSADLTGT